MRGRPGSGGLGGEARHLLNLRPAPPFAVSQSAAAGRVSEGAGGAGGRRTRHPGRSPVGVPWRRDFSSWFRVGLGPSRGWLRPVRGSYRPVPKARSSAVLLGTSERLPRHTPVTVKTVLYKQMHVHEAHAASRRSLARETTRNPCGRDRAKASRSRNLASSARKAVSKNVVIETVSLVPSLRMSHVPRSVLVKVPRAQHCPQRPGEARSSPCPPGGPRVMGRQEGTS